MLWIIWAGICLLIYFLAPALFHNAETFWPRVPVFLVGLKIAPYIKESRRIERKNFLQITVLANLASLAVQAYFCLQGAEVAYSFWPRLLYLPLAISFCILTCAFFEKKSSRHLALAFLGGITLEIYLLNQRMISAMTDVCESLMGESVSALILGNAVGIAITILLAWIINRALKRLIFFLG